MWGNVTVLNQADFLSGGGQMEKLIRQFDWAKTPLGSLESWPTSLKYAISACLNSGFPTVLYCGTDNILIYNDAFIPIVGKKHPQILGLSAKEGRSEIWPVLEPLVKQVLTTGTVAKKDKTLQLLDQHGFLEENYLTCSFNPVGIVEGKINSVMEILFNITQEVLHERHIHTLKNVAECAVAAKTIEDACRTTLEALSDNDADIPFALLYLVDQQSNQATLKGNVRLTGESKAAPASIKLDEPNEPQAWPLTRIIKTGKKEVFDISHFTDLPTGCWDKAPRQVVIIPLFLPGHTLPLGIFIVGINPMQAYDENYLNFYSMVAQDISDALANAWAVTSLEEEISKHKQTETALVKSEESYRILAKISPVGIFHADKDGKVFYINEKGCVIVGVVSEPCEDKLSQDLGMQFLHPEDRERVLSLWHKLCKQEIASFKSEYRYLRPNKSVVWVITEAVTEKNSQDQVIGFIGTITDITEIKELENAQRKRQEQFIDTMCHELRNPLNGIYGNVNLQEANIVALEATLRSLEAKDLPPVLKEKLQKHLEQDREANQAIDRCARHQKTIADDVLSLSKLDAGKIILNPENFDAKKITEDAIAMLETEINHKNIQLHTEIAHQDIKINADPNRLAQVLLNLLSNAVKFTPEKGEITIGLQILEEKADIKVLQFSIKDTGVGLTPEEQTQLFNRFTQVRQRTSQEYGDSGLGLAISKNLVELMGGTITVEGEKWKGSKFTFTIKGKSVTMEENSAPKISTRSPQQATPPKISRHILIVEDNLINQKLLIRMLKAENYHYYVANNGKEAVEIFEKTPIDTILMDIEMPVMNGLEATKKIREIEKQHQIPCMPVPIIGLSGNARQEQIDEALQAGMNAYLVKPYERIKLLEKITHLTKDRLPANEIMVSASVQKASFL